MTAKPFQWLGCGIGFALLCRIQSVADIAPHLGR